MRPDELEVMAAYVLRVVRDRSTGWATLQRHRRLSLADLLACRYDPAPALQLMRKLQLWTYAPSASPLQVTSDTPQYGLLRESAHHNEQALRMLDDPKVLASICQHTSSPEELKRAAERALGRRTLLLQRLSVNQLRQLLQALAHAQAQARGVKPTTVLHEMLCNATGPFRSYRYFDTYTSDQDSWAWIHGEVLVPVRARGSRVVHLVDAELSRRLIITRPAGSKEWVLACHPLPQQVSEFNAERDRELITAALRVLPRDLEVRHCRFEEVADQVVRLLGGDAPPLAASLSYLDRALTLPRPYTRTLACFAPREVMVPPDYRESRRLRERAKKLRPAPHHDIDEAELADVLGRHAIARAPAQTLRSLLGEAAFLDRSLSDAVKTDKRMEALESLYCHRLPAGLCHLRLPPLPSRLKTILEPQTAYRPISPFA